MFVLWYIILKFWFEIFEMWNLIYKLEGWWHSLTPRQSPPLPSHSPCSDCFVTVYCHGQSLAVLAAAGCWVYPIRLSYPGLLQSSLTGWLAVLLTAFRRVFLSGRGYSCNSDGTTPPPPPPPVTHTNHSELAGSVSQSTKKLSLSS